MAPLDDAAGFNVWTARFLSCHLLEGLSDWRPTKTCDRLYGTGSDNICYPPDPSDTSDSRNYLKHICIQGEESWPETQKLADGTTYACEMNSGGKVGPKCKRRGASPSS